MPPTARVHLFRKSTRTYTSGRTVVTSSTLCGADTDHKLDWQEDDYHVAMKASCFRCRTVAGIAKVVTFTDVPEGQVGRIVKFPKRKPMAYASRPDMDEDHSYQLDRYEGGSSYWLIPKIDLAPCVLCGHAPWNTDYPDPFVVPMFEVASAKKKAWMQHVTKRCAGKFLLILGQPVDAKTVRLGAVRCTDFNPASYLTFGPPIEPVVPKSRFARLLDTDPV